MNVTQTCGACPSQWDLEWNGIDYYVRYRYGILTVSHADDIMESIERWEIGDGLDGVMTTEEMLSITTPYLQILHREKERGR